jgi:hypothetical protein
MPASDEQNPTLNGFRKAMNHPPGNQLAQTTLRGVADTLTHHKNDVKHHDQFCAWRIILFKEHCVVASYFPQVGVWDTPHYVFKRSPETVNSYYAIFEHIFEELSRRHGFIDLRRSTDPSGVKARPDAPQGPIVGDGASEG